MPSGAWPPAAARSIPRSSLGCWGAAPIARSTGSARGRETCDQYFPQARARPRHDRAQTRPRGARLPTRVARPQVGPDRRPPSGSLRTRDWSLFDGEEVENAGVRQVALVHECDRPGAADVLRPDRIPVHGRQEHPRTNGQVLELIRERDPASIRQVYVDQRGVRFQLDSGSACGSDAVRLTHDLQPRCGEDARGKSPEGGVVVDYEDGQVHGNDLATKGCALG